VADPGDRLFTRRFATATLGNVVFFVGVTSFLALPVHLAALGANRAEIGHVMGSFGLTSLVAIPVTGALADRYGRRRFMLAGSLLSMLFAVGWLLVQQMGPLAYALRLLQGAAFSLAFVATNAVVVDLAPPQALGRSIALFGAMTLVSHAVGPTFGEWVAVHYGFPSLFWLSATAFALACVLFLFLPDTTPTHAVSTEPPPGMLRLALRRGAVGALVAAFTTAITFGCAIHFMAVFVRERGLTSHAPFFVSYVGAAIFVRLLAGGLGDRVGHRRVSGVACIGFAITAFGFAWLSSKAGLYALAVGFGLSHGLAYPSANALFLQDAPISMRGRGMALFNLAFNVGVTLSGFAAGEIAQRFDWSVMWFTASAAAVCGSVALFLDSPERASV
jgi:MFS family permease